MFHEPSYTIDRCMLARDFFCEGGKCPTTDEEEKNKCLVDHKYCSAFQTTKKAKKISKELRKMMK
jgi:hypothetical protein